jgi:hypothetical protein
MLFAFMGAHYQEMTGIYYLYLSTPVAIIMFFHVHLLSFLCSRECVAVLMFLFHELLHVTLSETYQPTVAINFIHKKKY